MYALATRITFICPMKFNAFPMDVQRCKFQVKQSYPVVGSFFDNRRLKKIKREQCAVIKIMFDLWIVSVLFKMAWMAVWTFLILCVGFNLKHTNKSGQSFPLQTVKVSSNVKAILFFYQLRTKRSLGSHAQSFSNYVFWGCGGLWEI